MAEFTMMTWNVENLFSPDDPDGPDPADFDAKVASLAAVIDEVAPDVLAMQEVGSEDALMRLQSVLAHDMPHRLLGVPDGREIRVALLSRSPLEDTQDVQRFPDRLLPVQTGDGPGEPDAPATTNQMGRGGLQATVDAGNEGVQVLVCHLKSKLLTFPDGRFFPHDDSERARVAAYALYRRASEATTLRVHLNTVLAGGGRERAVILAGDLNDEPNAATTQILLGPPGSEIGTGGFDSADQGDGDRLWNLAPLIPAEERFTRRFEGRDELIDHVMVSHRLVHRTTAVHTVTATPQLPSVGADPLARAGDPGSDHSAVVARFALD